MNPHDIVLTPTVTAGAYSASDAVGGLLTFAGAGDKNTDHGTVLRLVIVDDAMQNVALTLWLFNQTFTAMVDNAEWDIADSDNQNCIGAILVAASDYSAGKDNSVASVDCNFVYALSGSGTSLYGQLVTAGTPTYAAADDITVKLTVSE